MRPELVEQLELVRKSIFEKYDGQLIDIIP